MAEEFYLSTLENIPGSDVEEHYGIVSGSNVKSYGKFMSFMSKFKVFMGGEIGNLSSIVDDAYQKAADAMKDNAKKMGANCVLNVRFQAIYTRPGIIEVNAYGTAVKIMKY